MRKLNFRSLAEVIDADDLYDPQFQSDHPTVKGVADIAFFNALPDYGQKIIEQILSSGQDISIKEAYKVTRDSDPDIDDLEELLFTGLMTDIDYEDYLETKEKKPGITARKYFNYVCANTEKDRDVLKLARIFEAIVDAKDTQEEYLRAIPREEFEANRHNSKWVNDNLDALTKAKRNW